MEIDTNEPRKTTVPAGQSETTCYADIARFQFLPRHGRKLSIPLISTELMQYINILNICEISSRYYSLQILCQNHRYKFLCKENELITKS